jgi:predicted phage baseplate assembly protein
MAFAADAQIYGLGRLRQDERRGYAALMGIRPHGPRPAQGLLWPEDSVGAPAPAAGQWLAPGTPASTPGDAPPCSLAQGVWFTPARLMRLTTRLPDATETDQTAANGRPGASFAPFDDAPMPATELRLRFEGALVRGCDLGAGQAPVLSIGVEAEPFGTLADPPPAAPERPSAVLTAWVAGAQGFDQPVAILSDGTGAFAHSGAMLLRLPDMLTLSTAPDTVEIALRLTAGAFSLPPRVLRIAVDALAVRQVSAAWFEQGATGLPDQLLTLTGDAPADGEPVTVRLLGPAGPENWSPIADLEQAGPTDRVFVFDRPVAFRFGNGVNGAVPPLGTTIRADYAATAGQAGNLLAQTGWSVGGVAVRFANVDPLAGGEDGDTLDDLRHTARVQVANLRPLVTDADLQDAALAAPGLHVARAEVIDGYDPVAPCLAGALGTRTLVALRQRRRSEAAAPPAAEDRGWLTALERYLRPRLPIGERLRVAGPDYVSIAVRASLVVRQGSDTAAIVAAAAALLSGRLAPLPVAAYEPWPLGRAVAVLTLAGWLRRIAGVVAVSSLTVNELASGVVALRAHQLPSLTIGTGDITAAVLGAAA